MSVVLEDRVVGNKVILLESIASLQNGGLAAGLGCRSSEL